LAFKRAGECFEKLELPFKAGQKYEAAALLSKELKQSNESIDFYQNAAIQFQMHGASDKASEVFLKSAKVAEEANQIDKAIEVVMQSIGNFFSFLHIFYDLFLKQNKLCFFFNIDLLEADQKWLFVPANYRAATALLVKKGQ